MSKSTISCLGILFLVGLTSHQAASAEWVVVGADTQSRVMVDTDSIASEMILNDTYTKAWLRQDYVAPQIIGRKRFRSVMTLEYFKCAERRSANLQATYYAEPVGNRMVFHTEGSYLGAVVFEDVKPGSIGEAIFRATCLKRR